MAPKFGRFALLLCFLWASQALRRKNPGNKSDADALLDVDEFDYTAVISGSVSSGLPLNYALNPVTPTCAPSVPIGHFGKTTSRVQSCNPRSSILRDRLHKLDVFGDQPAGFNLFRADVALSLHAPFPESCDTPGTLLQVGGDWVGTYVGINNGAFRVSVGGGSDTTGDVSNEFSSVIHIPCSDATISQFLDGEYHEVALQLDTKSSTASLYIDCQLIAKESALGSWRWRGTDTQTPEWTGARPTLVGRGSVVGSVGGTAAPWPVPAPRFDDPITFRFWLLDDLGDSRGTCEQVTTKAPVACETIGHRTHPQCKLGNTGICHGTVKYGYGDKWATKQMDGEFKCSNTVFGDPYLNQAKECTCKEAPSWVLGNAGETCDATCGATKRVCDANMQSGITDANSMRAASKEAGHVCPPISSGMHRGYAGNPHVGVGSDHCYFLTPGGRSVCNGNEKAHHRPLCYCKAPANEEGEVLFAESFEGTTVKNTETDLCPGHGSSGCILDAWINPSHPHYVRIVSEDYELNNVAWSTPYGKNAMSVFGYQRCPDKQPCGAETSPNVLTEKIVAGVTYVLNFNVAAGKKHGDYQVELAAVDEHGSSNRKMWTKTTLAKTTGIASSKDFSYTDKVSYTATADSPLGQRLAIRLLDGDSNHWSETPLFDNIKLTAVRHGYMVK